MPKICFSALGAQVHPLHPLATPMVFDLSKSSFLDTKFHFLQCCLLLGLVI